MILIKYACEMSLSLSIIISYIYLFTSLYINVVIDPL